MPSDSRRTLILAVIKLTTIIAGVAAFVCQLRIHDFNEPFWKELSYLYALGIFVSVRIVTTARELCFKNTKILPDILTKLLWQYHGISITDVILWLFVLGCWVAMILAFDEYNSMASDVIPHTHNTVNDEADTTEDPIRKKWRTEALVAIILGIVAVIGDAIYSFCNYSKDSSPTNQNRAPHELPGLEMEESSPLGGSAPTPNNM